MYNTIIIEDDPMVMNINLDYIKEHKEILVTETFQNGKEALEYIKKGNHVDLIILDIYTPVMNGFEFIRKLRKSGYNCAVIPVTAANERESVAKLLNSNIFDYLVKPFNKKRMNLAIERFINYKNSNKENQIITQGMLDKMFGIIQKKSSPVPDTRTLEIIMDCIKEHRNERLKVKTISKEVGLTVVTVRKYMNYLANESIIQKTIDHNTKGKPADVYIYN